MSRSSNNFSDTTQTPSGNSFTDVSFTAGSGSMVRLSFSLGTNPWTGQNLSADAFGFDSMFSGTPFGIGIFGGVYHFAAIKDRP